MYYKVNLANELEPLFSTRWLRVVRLNVTVYLHSTEWSRVLLRLQLNLNTFTTSEVLLRFVDRL